MTYYHVETYEKHNKNMIIHVVCEFITDNKFTEPKLELKL